MLICTRRAAAGPLAVAVVAAALLAGCSGGGDAPASASGSSTTGASSSGGDTSGSATPSSTAPSVADVFRAARTSALSAESGRAKGTVTREGARLGVDVQGLAGGSNQTVFITTPKGGVAEVLTVGNGYWVGGDEAHWTEITGDAKAAKGLVGKYAPVTESDATELGAFTLRNLLTDAFAWPELAVLESDTGPATQGEVDGRPAWVLGRPGGAQLWVAADGSDTLLRVVGPTSDPTDLTFSDWGRAPTYTEPPPAKVIEN